MKKVVVCLMIVLGLLVNSAAPVQACRACKIRADSIAELAKGSKPVKIPKKGVINRRANKQSKKLRRIIAKDGWKLIKVRRAKKYTRVYTYEFVDDHLVDRFRVIQKIGKKASKFKIGERYSSQKRAISDYKKGHFNITAFYFNY